MIWLANVALFLALWLIGRKTFRTGYTLGVIGSILYAVVSIQIHRWDFASFNIAMTLLNGWNLCQNWNKTGKTAVTKSELIP